MAATRVGVEWCEKCQGQGFNYEMVGQERYGLIFTRDVHVQVICEACRGIGTWPKTELARTDIY